jgi:hypothetical protein
MVSSSSGGSDTVCPRKVLEYIETYVGLRSPCIRISLLCLYTLKLSAEKGNKKKGTNEHFAYINIWFF